MKRFYQITALGLLTVLLTCSLAPKTTASASTITSESIQQKESQIADAQSEKKELEDALSDIKEIKKSLEAQKSNLQSYITSLDANLTELQEKIDSLKATIEQKEADIRTAEDELAAAIATQEAQYEAMKERIKFMYEQGDTYYIELLVSADSYSDMINKLDYIQMLSEYDSQKLAEYALVTQYVQTTKEALEAEKEVLETAKADVESEEAAVETLIAEKEAQVTAYSTDISTKQSAIEEYEAEIASQNATIAALEEAVAEEKRRLIAENMATITYDGGMFAWPAPSYTRISDDYGYRIHPILGTEQFHNGVDMAAPSGSPILAAYDGEVVAAS
ncbi:MAG: peptidase M23, partial [Lachnospiraceae bacterium]|nr:peptidase M23 [Lachnospiraceae bacterium]